MWDASDAGLIPSLRFEFKRWRLHFALADHDRVQQVPYGHAGEGAASAAIEAGMPPDRPKAGRGRLAKALQALEVAQLSGQGVD